MHEGHRIRLKKTLPLTALKHHQVLRAATFNAIPAKIYYKRIMGSYFFRYTEYCQTFVPFRVLMYDFAK
jgi:hypothetical protein